MAVLTLTVVEIVQVASYIRSTVESGLDDPDNLGHLGHFFGG